MRCGVGGGGCVDGGGVGGDGLMRMRRKTGEDFWFCWWGVDAIDVCICMHIRSRGCRWS